jgi:hypothetical protein
MIFGMLIVISGCGPQKLNRERATEILDKIANKPSMTELGMSSDQVRRLSHLNAPDSATVKQMMNLNSGKFCGARDDMQVAVGVRPLCPNYIPPGITWRDPGRLVILAKPIKWKLIDITGISDVPDAQSEKLVDYTWQYDLSGFPKSFLDIYNPPLQRGHALFRLYDDGWRFVEFK